MAGPALLAASAAFFMLQAVDSFAAARSHSHHASARPLPVSSFVETGRRAGPRSRRAVSHQRSTPASSRSTGSRGNSAIKNQGRSPRRTPNSRSRGRREPANLAPMDRAIYSTARGRRLYARNQPHAFGRTRRYRRETIVAEVSGRSSNGAYLAHLHAKALDARGRTFARNSPFRSPVIVAAPQPSGTLASAHNSTLTTNDPLTQRTQSGIYARGTAQPDEDNSLSGHQASANAAIIGTAEAVTAPSTLSSTAPRNSQPQVVSGFGGEVAIASPAPTDRPGGTRRRNHPIPASALPEETAPVSLEDREAITDAAVRPSVLPEIYDRSGHLVMPSPLKGSREVLVHQNTMAASDGLERIQDDGELDRLRAEHLLVSFPSSESLRINEDLPSNRRYARPWTVLFAEDIARDFYARFRQPLQVNSAVRTVSYQLRLQRVNGNAAATDGDGASPHLTGQAIDLGKRGMSSAELAWMRDYLLPLMQAGKIDVEEEFQQACFHISVYRRYAGGRKTIHEVAQLGPSSTRKATTDPDADQP